MKWKKFLLVLPALLITGCAGTFTNLTPLEQTRNGNNLYPVEVEFSSPSETLRWNSIHPYLLVNGQLYDMHQTPMMTNRWEGFVPASPMESAVTYRYKFDYLSDEFSSQPKPNSSYSPAYHLQINQ
jgi:hypothetical protein